MQTLEQKVCLELYFMKNICPCRSGSNTVTADTHCDWQADESRHLKLQAEDV